MTMRTLGSTGISVSPYCANPTTRAQWAPRHLTDERKLDVVEQLVVVAEQAGISLMHLAMAFAVAHRGVSAAVIGPRTLDHLDGLLAGADTVLDDDTLDAIVAPGTDVGPIDVAYTLPVLAQPILRRRAADDRAAA